MIWSIIAFLIVTTAKGFRTARREGRITSYRPYVLLIAACLVIGGAFGVWLAARLS
jgi:hypothetical protein